MVVEIDSNGGYEMEVCIVASCGGHLAEARALRPAFVDYAHFYVVNDAILLPDDMQGRTYFISHAERDWRVLKNLWEAWSILRRERPTVILSTGAGPAVPFALVGRLLRVPVVFVEISAQVTEPSVTGRIMYRLAARFFYQWRALAPHFPEGTYGGPILWSS
jgi:UDP-N-acetylglucosamine:LPS N-acetylglucosamine transferase